ncbi:MAG TPA: hypothetical protein VHT91_33275 [Kofleriaceae bacterium]|jgi:hypothetical protein|nr:hypothetical protein [Kofleriaceae bacterium]
MFDLYNDRKPRTSILSKAIDGLLGAVVAVLRPFVKRYHPELVNELNGKPRLSLGLRFADRRIDKKDLLDKENP